MESEGNSDRWRHALLVAVADDNVRGFLRARIQSAGLSPRSVSTYTEAVVSLEAQVPDVVLVWAADHSAARSFLVQARKLTGVSIISMGPPQPDNAVAELLRSGADDYVPLPLGPLELTARIEAVLRRTTGVRSDAVIQAGPVCVDMATRCVRINGTSLRLSPFEFKLLVALSAHPGKVLDHTTLIERVWGSRHVASVDSLRTIVRRLRARLGQLGDGCEELVVSAKGYGYYMRTEEARSDD